MAWSWLCALALAISQVAAADVILQKDSKTLSVSPHVRILHDPSGQLTIKDLLSAESARTFDRPAALGEVLNLGLTRDVHWVQLLLRLEPGADQYWILDLPFHAISHAEAYLVMTESAGEAAEPVLLPRLGGYRYHAWQVRLPSGRATIYLKVQSSGSLTLPLQLQSEESFLLEEQRHLFMQAMYFGALLILLLYSVAYGWVNRERNYVLFAGFMGFAGMAMFLGNGLTSPWSWLEEVRWRNGVESVGYAIAGAWAMAFTRRFLRPVQPWLDKGLQLVGSLYAMLALAIVWRTVFAGAVSWLEYATPGLSILSGLLIFWALLQAHQRGSQHNRFFELAWVCMTLGALIASLRTLVFLPSGTLLLYAVQIGIGAAAIFFSLAIFMQVHHERNARENALKQSAEDRQKLIEHLQLSEQRLEKTVTTRTQELSDALASEKRMREQYVRFGAMISHEFRNPLGVIETQTALLERELAAGIDRAGKRIGSVRAATQRLALLFEKWLQSDRLNNIRDRLEGTPVMLDAWLQDIVQRCHAYHFNHEIRLLPHSPLGAVKIDEPLMRIALLNLIDNACKYSPAQTEVSVLATIEEGMLCISVSDQGPGIPEPLRLKIFEEYYRVDPDTPVPGVGLGLPFVKKIVDLHGGFVSAGDTADGPGACFTIRIPIQAATV